MIRRSTLVFLACLSALSATAVPARGTPTAVLPGSSRAQTALRTTEQVLVAQASGGSAETMSVTAALDLGSRGSAVEVLQRRLQQIGYYGGRIDGIYGLATQRAVSAFQTAAAIEPTGQLDENTWRQLQSFAAPEQLTALTSENVNETPSSEVASPVVAQLPAIETAEGADEEAGEGAAEEASIEATMPEGGSLGKILGLSLGLLALIASFGVGFFIANRSKTEVDSEGDWVRPDANPDTGSLYADTQAISRSNGLSVKDSNASRPTANLTTVSAETPVAANGQMGEAMPLAQKDIIDGLISDLRTPDPTRRRKAIWELGQRGNSLAMQPLVEAMAEADSKEKSLVLAALSEIGIRSMKPMNRALAIALQDENPEVRKNAIRDFTRVYELVVQISQMLGYATEDEDLEVRQTATWALDQLSRIRRSQDIDANMRSLPTGGAASIDLLSSESPIRRPSPQ